MPEASDARLSCLKREARRHGRTALFITHCPEGRIRGHVEPYLMQSKDGSLQPLLSAEGRLQAAPWTTIWGLRTEPFVAVVDGEGLVRAKFEGAITVEELEEALSGLR